MQIKTIQKNISNKLNEWLGSITDDTLKEDLRKNVLVSGGSITSMLLGEPVNDYDVYIKNMDVLKRLTLYYTAAYSNDITVLDGRDKAILSGVILDKYKGRFTDDEFSEYDTAYNISLRNLKDNQIKLFFLEKNGGKRVNEDKKAEDLYYSPLFFSPNAISLSNDLQIVIRFNGDAETIHKTFDFVHATNYFTFEDGLVTNKAALESILTKQLKYQGSQYPLTTIIRVRKFLKRNWNIGAGELLKIMFQISELDLKNPDVLEEQLIGVDVAYFGKLIEVLRGIENLETKMTSEYLNTIIDKVFNDAHEED